MKNYILKNKRAILIIIIILSILSVAYITYNQKTNYSYDIYKEIYCNLEGDGCNAETKTCSILPPVVDEKEESKCKEDYKKYSYDVKVQTAMKIFISFISLSAASMLGIDIRKKNKKEL